MSKIMRKQLCNSFGDMIYRAYDPWTAVRVATVSLGHLGYDQKNEPTICTKPKPKTNPNP